MQQDGASPPQTALLARRLLGIVGGSWKSQATYVAAELRIADLLADGPKTSADLAAATDICRERDDGAFETTPMGSLLRTNGPGSLRSWQSSGARSCGRSGRICSTGIAQSDLNMLVVLAAQERTEAEFRALLGSAGLRVTRILSAGETFSLIEAVPSQ